jgi:2-C-methyl-D-erythritol 2,4-cyclodiphosphate synthase
MFVLKIIQFIKEIMVGLGYDSHKLALGESLILGGVIIEFEKGTVAHSDGDVILHALCDALLGAAGLGDIGEHFPDSDEKYKNYDSSKFVINVMELVEKAGFELVNIDITIILEKPKLKIYKEKMKNRLAELCNIKPEIVNVKAKTNEGIGFVGREEGVAAYCICEICKKSF